MIEAVLCWHFEEDGRREVGRQAGTGYETAEGERNGTQCGSPQASPASALALGHCPESPGPLGPCGALPDRKTRQVDQIRAQRGGSALLVAVGACGGYTARPDHLLRARLRGVTVAVAALVGGPSAGQDKTGQEGHTAGEVSTGVGIFKGGPSAPSCTCASLRPLVELLLFIYFFVIQK